MTRIRSRGEIQEMDASFIHWDRCDRARVLGSFRPELIEPLRRSVASGGYRPSAAEIAKAILICIENPPNLTGFG